MSQPVLTVRDLSVQVASPSGAQTVLDRLGFDLPAGETLCLAGESGSGKSMTALAIMGLLPKPMCRIAGGSIKLGETELVGLADAQYRRIRTERIAMIFQEPMTSLNPLMTVRQQLVEALLQHDACSHAEAPRRALQLLRDVQLTEPERRLKQYPHELSGGMRQRVMIAIALACDPEILIADEPTTALDVTIQAQILALLKRLQQRYQMSILLITHDLTVVKATADKVCVMYAGQIVEQAEVSSFFQQPKHPYVHQLLASV